MLPSLAETALAGKRDSACVRHVQEAPQVTLAGMSQATLAWCGDALFDGTPEEAVAFYRDLAGGEETVELLGAEAMPAFV